MFFSAMQIEQTEHVIVETIELQSGSLQRTVKIDFYQHDNDIHADEISLLLFNDGQDLVTMNFKDILQKFYKTGSRKPLLVVGIHCGEDRKNEYGMSVAPSFDGLGAKAAIFERFVVDELLPFIHSRFHNLHFREIAYAGFSLGALSALDISWNNPEIFSKVGVFSGSLWWRSVDKDDKDYDQRIHRMMHVQIREGDHRPGMKFFFECGEQDEWEDRNRNGVIDSIDDTIDLMRELVKKGFREGKDIYYLQMPNGKHNVESWGKAMPAFLKWGWG
jgi:enterochelin esterase-like enzyme